MQELFQRLEHLERKCRRMDGRIAELEEKVIALSPAHHTEGDGTSLECGTQSVDQSAQSEDSSEWHGGVVSLTFEEPEESSSEQGADGPRTFITKISEAQEVGLTVPLSSGEGQGRASSPVRHFYLPAPTPEGLFQQASEREQIGKSIYRLTTSDGQNGTFLLLDTPDAIATAMISVSTFIKPVCKVNGPTAQYPRHIITEEDGKASREGTGWRVTRKAVVRFE